MHLVIITDAFPSYRVGHLNPPRTNTGRACLEPRVGGEQICFSRMSRAQKEAADIWIGPRVVQKV